MRTKPAAPDAEERFDAVVDELAGAAEVSLPGSGRGFGSSAIRVRNKIFAMLVRGRLVVKLPQSRVDALVAAGEGDRFDANKGTPMKEWLILDPGSTADWVALAREAMQFVGADQRAR
jgi:hypothetical protein